MLTALGKARLDMRKGCAGARRQHEFLWIVVDDSRVFLQQQRLAADRASVKRLRS
jgi:hypothetical protein